MCTNYIDQTLTSNLTLTQTPRLNTFTADRAMGGGLRPYTASEGTNCKAGELAWNHSLEQLYTTVIPGMIVYMYT